MDFLAHSPSESSHLGIVFREVAHGLRDLTHFRKMAQVDHSPPRLPRPDPSVPERRSAWQASSRFTPPEDAIQTCEGSS